MRLEKIRERLKSSTVLVLLWLGILFLCPLLIIAAYHSRSPVELGLGIGLTMLVYFGTGIVIALEKWGLRYE